MVIAPSNNLSILNNYRSDWNLILLKGVQLMGFQFQDVPADEYARNEREVRELLTSGRVKPHVGAVFPLDDIAAALRHVRDGCAIGKVLIDLR